MAQSKKMSQKEAYESVIADSNAIHDFVMKLPDNCDLTTVRLPAQLAIYVDDYSNSEVIKQERDKAKGIALALGGAGALAGGLGALGAGASITGAAGLITGSFFPPLLPIVLVSGIAGLITKKLINRKDIERASKNIKESREKLCKILANKLDSYSRTQEQFDEVMKKKAEVFSKKFKDTSTKVAIILDDLAHNNVNKRIQQYNQIVLDQYNNQAELANEYKEILKEYNKLLEENEKLKKEVEKLQRMISGVDVQNSYISGALAKAEGEK